MDGLINTTLIKSAKFDFTSVNLDGNTLFVGANGAGKTTPSRGPLRPRGGLAPRWFLSARCGFIVCVSPALIHSAR